MQGRQVDAGFDRRGHRIVDQAGVMETRPTVDHTMPHRIDRKPVHRGYHFVERRGVVSAAFADPFDRRRGQRLGPRRIDDLILDT